MEEKLEASDEKRQMEEQHRQRQLDDTVARVGAKSDSFDAGPELKRSGGKERRQAQAQAPAQATQSQCFFPAATC